MADDVLMEQLRMKNCKNTCDPPPTKQHVMPDGTIAIEKLNPIPCHKKMIDPNGHVCQVSLATGFTIRGLGAHNPYGVQKLEEKLKKGWIPYDLCPLATGQIVGKKGDKACQGKFSRDQCCEHVEAIKEARRAKYVGQQNKFKRKMATNQDKLIQILWDQAGDQAKAKAEAGATGGKLFA